MNPVIRDEALGLLKGALAHVTPTAEDRKKIEAYAAGYADALLKGDKSSAEGFFDALTLTLGTYALKAEDAREKLVYDTIFTAARIGIAALL